MIYQFNQYFWSAKFLAVASMVLLTFVYVFPAYALGPVVNTAVDENDSSCVDGDCSLRDAIETANPGETITFNNRHYWK